MLQIGLRFPEKRFGPLGAEAVAAYAQASGDDNPLHADAEFARKFGFSAPLVHGLFMMGLIEPACRAWGLAGAVVAIESRFVSPVLHDTELRYSGNVVSAGTDRLRIRIVARDSAAVLCLVGSIVLRMDDAATI
jgi:3-hydroxybutyryl-CoA dehydratase